MSLYYCDLSSDYVKGVYKSLGDFIYNHPKYNRQIKQIVNDLMNSESALIYESDGTTYNYLLVIHDQNIS